MRMVGEIAFIYSWVRKELHKILRKQIQKRNELAKKLTEMYENGKYQAEREKMNMLSREKTLINQTISCIKKAIYYLIIKEKEINEYYKDVPGVLISKDPREIANQIINDLDDLEKLAVIYYIMATKLQCRFCKLCEYRNMSKQYKIFNYEYEEDEKCQKAVQNVQNALIYMEWQKLSMEIEKLVANNIF